MKTQPITLNDLIMAQQALNKVLNKGYILLFYYEKATGDREALIANNEELEDANANLITTLGIILIIGLIAFFQANNDGAMIAESIIGNSVSSTEVYPWYTYGFGIGICLFGFFMAKGAAPQYRYIYDKFGQRKISGKWWGAVSATIFYLLVHILIGVYIFIQGGETGHWSAFWPLILALIDVFLALTFGSIILLTLRRTWYDIKLVWVLRRLNRAVQAINKASEQLLMVIRMYNQSNASVESQVEIAHSREAITEFREQFRKQIGLIVIIDDDENYPDVKKLSLPAGA